MLQDTTQGKQAVESGDPQTEIRYNDNEAWTTVEWKEELVVEEARGDRSTISTDGSHNMGGSSNHPSSFLGTETDPTSGILDDMDFDLDLDRIHSESDKAMCGSDPALRDLSLHSTEAVYGFDSVRSGQSESSTKYSNSREDIPIAVNPGKLSAIGDHFESDTETSAQRFHDPENPWEAQRIKDKIEQVNATMDDIELHPEEHFRDHGSSYQVSARPKEPLETTFDVEGDIAPKRKVLPPDPLPLLDMKRGHHVGRLKRRNSCFCIIM